MKINSQLLLVCALFVLLVVLCYSWVSKEMFQNNNTPSVSTSVLEDEPDAEFVSGVSVNPVMQSSNKSMAPVGNNGSTYYQDFSRHMESRGLPMQ